MVNLSDVKSAIAALTRQDGEWFCGHTPETVAQYYDELKRFALSPLMNKGLSLEQALQVEHAMRMHSIRTVLGDIRDTLWRMEDAEGNEGPQGL